MIPSPPERHRIRFLPAFCLWLAMDGFAFVEPCAGEPTVTTQATKAKNDEGANATAKQGEVEASAASSDWRSFRGGPALHGFRDVEVGDAPRLLWTYDAGEAIESTAAIAGGRVFVGVNDGRLLALALTSDEKKGELVWTFETKEKAPVKSSPAVRDDRIFFGDGFGRFYALDARTGKTIWEREIGLDEIVSSATFHGETLVFGSYDTHLYCLEQASGKERWKLATGGPIHATPAIVEGKTFAAGCDALLHVVDVASGAEDRQIPLGDYSAASPAAEGEILYLGTFAQEVVAIDWKKGERAWTYVPERSFPFQSSAGLTAELVVIGGRDKQVHAIDRKTGKLRWSFPTRARVDSSPVIARDRVFIGGGDQNLYLLDLETGKEVWRFETDGGFLASASLAAGRLVISDDLGRVYCFDVSTESKESKGSKESQGSKDESTETEGKRE